MLNHTQQDIVANNHNLIYFMCNKYNLDIEEYYDVLAIGLCKAAKSFDCNKSKFATYACTCMLNEVKMTKRKHKIETISLNNQIINDDSQIELLNLLEDSKSNFNYDLLENLDGLSDWYFKISERNKKILNMYKEGINQEEIAKKFNVSQSHISRVIKKLRKEFYTYVK